ncbi:M28 family metallopeptidase [Mycobacterium sp. MYCO198283]|uniref:M28 family metallopeptidase n=1 Tax=Mycobacterium sp. MYCO198283 TaxID=2883505 RepID=UPI001E402169|nr:M28 family metallopeptidase [Mycobacterium sp. MYCO198283]MCG5432199.1 M28 family metallopeptidase [Mycobacterium sp. MYCO198283]
MTRRAKTGAVLLAAVAVVAAGCSRTTATQQESEPPTAEAAGRFADELSGRVSIDAMMAHLQSLQDIANAHGGTRAAGTPGYEASVDYVATTLRDKGFDVQTPEFDYRAFTSGEVLLRIGGQPVPAKVLEFSAGTAAQGVAGPLVAAPADQDPGCSASDYDGLPVRGAVVLVDRGTCPFADKEAAAAARGAVGLIVADNVLEERMGGTLGEDNTNVTLPAVGVSKPDGERLRSRPGPVELRVDATTSTVRSRNVVAQTKTGATDNVVVVGAHLDSVPEGPGINDNGSGTAAVLETAVQLGSSPEIANGVRFTFWGAEESGLVGSRRYVASLSLDQLRDIALYLNFDMLGSPNAGYLTYDGDQSIPPDERGVAIVPEGSAGIERTLAGYLDRAGKPAEDTAFDGRSDYDAFTRAGIPAGGLFSGAEDKMTADEAKEWGGKADEPFDPNYHQAGDTIDAVNRDALRINGDGAAYAVGWYAQFLGGRNGVPVPEDRVRHLLPPS